MMSDRFDEELMDDLAAGPEAGGHSAMDDFEGADEFDDSDEFEASDEFEGADEFDDSDEFDEMEDAGDAFEAEAASDEFEEAMTDALEAEDADEFFGKIGGFLKKVGRGVGKFARVVAPIASMIPIPQAQLIGKAAGMIGNVLADEGDEMDAFDELSDFAEEEDGLDALAPAIATVAIRSGLKNKVATLPRVQRRALVKTVTAATKHLVHKHGPQAVQAMPAIVAHARKVAIRQRLPAKHLPHLIARTAKAALKSPRLVRKLVGATNRLRTGRIGHRAGVGRGLAGTRHRGRAGRYGQAGHLGHAGHRGRSHRGVAGSAGSATCPGCGRRRSFRFGGPVRVTIESV
jgi:hypothetical protein